MKIFKFGGASVKDAQSIRNVGNIIQQYQTEPLLVVVSAMGKMTNAFEALLDLVWNKTHDAVALSDIKSKHFEICQELFSESHEVFNILENEFEKIQNQISKRETWKSYDWAYDQLVSFGEVISTKILEQYLQKEGLKTTWLDARKLVLTDDTWREGKVDWEQTENNIQKLLLESLQHKIGVTQGFLGGTSQKETTTLGREGSDFTGGIFAHCLNAQSLTIWKDVPGFMNADPKIVPNACLYEQLSYHETAEMSRYGASVVHPKTISPLAKKNIPLWVKSFKDVATSGTKVHLEKSKQDLPSIIFKKKQVILTFTTKDFGFISASMIDLILESFTNNHLKVNMLQTLAMQLSIVTNEDERKIQSLKDEISTPFNIQETSDIQLITLLNYNHHIIQEMIKNSKTLLVQQNQRVYQAALQSF